MLLHRKGLLLSRAISECREGTRCTAISRCTTKLSHYKIITDAFQVYAAVCYKIIMHAFQAYAIRIDIINTRHYSLNTLKLDLRCMRGTDIYQMKVPWWPTTVALEFELRRTPGTDIYHMKVTWWPTTLF